MDLRERIAGDNPAGRDAVNIGLQAVTGIPFVAGQATRIPCEKLHPFSLHTFKINTETADYDALRQSIHEHGIKQPLLVRPHAENKGDYEIIAGHRRCCVAVELGMNNVPCVVENCDNDTAIQLMGESNIQRPDWLPSEKAKTYRAHLEATQRKSGIQQGMRTDLTCANSLHKLKNRDISAKIWGISGQMFDNYMKLNDLSPSLLDMVDEGRIAMMGGYHLAFLDAEQQAVVSFVLEEYPLKKLTKGKGKELREAGNAGELDEQYVLRLMGLQKRESKAERQISIRFSSDTLLRGSTVSCALSDPDVLMQIEDLLVAYAEKNNLPLR